jgi:N-acetylated-alpha-linked acidic dipeptidase
VISDKMFLAVADPKQALIQPRPKPEVPYLNFAPLENALAALQRNANRFETVRSDASDHGESLPAKSGQPALDKSLLQLERSLLCPEGLPCRHWYQHLIYAPGFYTGYGVKTLPGVREAIEQRDWTEATQQIVIVAKAIEKFAAELDHCTDLLQGRSP